MVACALAAQSSVLPACAACIANALQLRHTRTCWEQECLCLCAAGVGVLQQAIAWWVMGAVALASFACLLMRRRLHWGAAVLAPLLNTDCMYAWR